MMTLAEKIRLVGILVFLAGLLCLPFTRTNPKSYQNAFNLSAMRSDFLIFGLWTIGIGLALIVESFVIKH